MRNLLNPRSVAIIGASESPAKFGGRVMHFLVQHGFKGSILPINPGAGEILGITAYASIGDAPGPIDVALLAVPAAQIPATLVECGNAGVAGCVILAADFAEVGEEGAARQDELVQIARARSMRLIGPNCLGFINPALKLALTSSVALAAEPMPTGHIGLVSQSGSLMASLISHAQDLGTGFSVAVSVGNQADLEICDFVEYFIENQATHAICAYIEGLKDGRRFLELAAQCRAAGKPLIAVKAGGSEAGARITASHTASLAGSNIVWEAACREHAVLLLDDPEAMIPCADFLLRFGAPRGDGVAALSPSGGTTAVTADRIAAAGLRLAQLSDATQRELHAIVPPTRPLNPLDVGGLPREQGLAGAQRCYELLAGDPDVAAVLVAVATTPQLDAKVRLWGELALACGKPTAILLTPGSLVDGARKTLRELGCPYTNRMDDALRVLKAALDYGTALRAPPEAAAAPPGFEPAACRTAAPRSGQLTEPEAKALLAAAGIATLPERLATSADMAVAAAQAIGYPVVLKAVCRRLVHKSDVGAVALGLGDESAVRTAWRDIGQRVARALPAAALEGCLVAPMASNGVELIVGAKWDAQFGPVVMVGAGGVLVELLRDVQVALAPVAPATARALLERLRAWPLLAGTRGRIPADVDALVNVMVRVGWLAATLGPTLVELDINPLLVRNAGDGAVALDARATVAAEPQ